MRCLNLFSGINCCLSTRSANINPENYQDEAAQRRRAYFRQFLSILCGYILMIDVGVQVSWSSPSLPYLTSNRSEIHISESEGAWLTATDSISSIIGFLLYPLIMNRIGRRYTILVFGVIQVFAWILLNLATNFTLLCLSRVVVGIGYGGSFGFLTIYIGEVSTKKLRGMFLSLDKICVNLGGFLINTAGAFLPYKTMNKVMIIVPILALGAFPLMLETPYFHLLKGHDDKAAISRMKLTGANRPEMVKTDIQRMKKTLEDCENSNKNAFHELFTDRGSRKALIIKFVTEFTYAFSGFLAIQSYAQDIFKATGSTLEPAYSAMIVTGVQIFAGLPSSQLVDRWGRRPIYLCSGILSAITLVVVGIFFFCKENIKADVSSFTLVPLLCMIVYQIVINMGISTIPYIYSGELFSVKVKGIACMLSSISHSSFGFLAKLTLPFLNEATGKYTPFWLFAAVCIIGPVIVFNITPETKGKNLEEVLDIMSGKQKRDRNQNERKISIIKL